jgi:hypothetical protein
MAQERKNTFNLSEGKTSLDQQEEEQYQQFSDQRDPNYQTPPEEPEEGKSPNEEVQEPEEQEAPYLSTRMQLLAQQAQELRIRQEQQAQDIPVTQDENPSQEGKKNGILGIVLIGMSKVFGFLNIITFAFLSILFLPLQALFASAYTMYIAIADSRKPREQRRPLWLGFLPLTGWLYTKIFKKRS